MKSYAALEMENAELKSSLREMVEVCDSLTRFIESCCETPDGS